MPSAGILGVGLYLPPEKRFNDWWTADVVSQWSSRPAQGAPDTALSPAARRCITAMAEQAADPFNGVRQRRVMPSEMTLLDMEEAAARVALASGGIRPSDVDLLLTNRTVPDVLLSNPACGLHQRLELPHECLSTHLDVATHSFMMQLQLAEAMLVAGRARNALLVQSCAPSRLIDPADRTSAQFGDAATAVVLGLVANERGVRAQVTFTDGRFPTTLVASVPGRTWYDEGKVRLHVADPRQMQQLFLGTVDACRMSVETALSRAKVTPASVGFLSVHQGTSWLRRIVQEETHLEHARSVESYSETGYLFASTIPAALAVGQEAGTLKRDDTVVLVGGGPGQTYGAAVLMWE